ncbi:MAG: cytochrome o ubiquinol oxidase subunit IV [Candidatus Pacebacteria bacterium]|nr:cytochrome o ubiquinol oxidase subunit IV [Candidatus Paceibacterota bacterium]
MNLNPLPNEYLEEIGAWPKGSRNIGAVYIVGFIFSLALTLGAYLLVVHQMLTPRMLITAVVALAGVQFVVQVMSFLHLGSGRAERARLLALGVTVVIVGILVGGSLWIMNNLNGRMMPSVDQMDAYMNTETGL